jgi:hypothetical protein
MEQIYDWTAKPQYKAAGVRMMESNLERHFISNHNGEK